MTHRFLLFCVGLVCAIGGFVVGRTTFLAGTPVTPTVTQAPTSTDRSAHDSMQTTMEGMTAVLSDKTGDAFDLSFLEEMIVHHEGAIAMAKRVQATSKRPELLKLAEDIIRAQSGEIAQMSAWKTEWFKR